MYIVIQLYISIYLYILIINYISLNKKIKYKNFDLKVFNIEYYKKVIK